MTTFDVVVVGSGPGGAVTAALLAESGLHVAVCEEGRWTEPGAMTPFSLDQLAAQYRNGGVTVALGRPAVAYAEARCMGGGSEVNSGLYHRPPEPVVTAWARHFGIRGLSAAALDTCSELVERDLDLAAATTTTPVSRASAVLARGAAALGWAASSVRRCATAHGERRTMTRSYLPRAVRAGATVLASHRVERILHDGVRAIGVVCCVAADGMTEARVVAARNVVLCAGAVHTAALLLRSGVPGVGRTLQVHPTVKVVARFPYELDPDHDVPVHQVHEFAPDLSFGGSVRSPAQVALILADDWDGRRKEIEHVESLGVYYAAIRPEGTGRVWAVPGLREPLVTYRLTGRDMALLRRGLSRLALLMLAADAEAVWPSVRGAPAVRTPGDIPTIAARFTRATASLMTVHLFSSVPMGERGECPADSFGRVKRFPNVYVNDASMLPTAPGVNPQGTIMALAYRNAEAWLTEGALRRG